MKTIHPPRAFAAMLAVIATSLLTIAASAPPANLGAAIAQHRIA